MSRIFNRLRILQCFEDEYDTMCDLLRSNDIDGDMFNAMLDNLLDLYGAKRLEGQQYYVVLPQDVKEL